MLRQRLRSLRGPFTPFTRWSKESAVIYFAIAFFPIMIAVGAVVDYSRAINYKTAIQAALDAAVLSGGRDGKKDWDKIALNTFNARLSSKYEQLPRPTFALNPSTGNYTGTVTSSQPTSVLGIINISSISVMVRAAAVAEKEDSFVLTLDHEQPKRPVWRVSNLSGDVTLTTSAGQQTTLADGAIFKPGNIIRTGQNSRVLLVRGEETILIASNSVIGIPTDVTEGISTTIYHWAGSIRLAVERRNEKHFEVITPYLAAVVKGTQFRVTVNNHDASVEVLRGQVEVADFRSGQYAFVAPGQAAKVLAQGSAGLSLSGSGALSPILRGVPRKSSVNPIDLSNGSFSSPAGTSNGRQVGVAPPKTETARTPASSERVPASDDSRNSGLTALGRFFSNADNQRSSNDSVAFGIAFATGIGVFTAFIVAALRRMRRRM